MTDAGQILQEETEMVRRIIKIDKEKCNGCGACADACHEGAIAMVNGKAELQREDYCDGLGDCLPACPAKAISFEEREAPAYNEEAVKKSKEEKLPCGCPGTQSKTLRNAEKENSCCVSKSASRLSQWPVQIKLVPMNAPYFNGADLLIAADCTAYAYGSMHEDFIKGRITLIGCPKLDGTDYSAKLSDILSQNDIRSVTVLRMEVPCCGGIEIAARNAVRVSGRPIPIAVITISTEGNIIG